jgi:hypothetical protein
MNGILSVVSTILYFITGIICLLMAIKTISSSRFLPFHEKASGLSWDEIDSQLQTVIVTTIRISGLGFLIIFLTLTILPILNWFVNDKIIKYYIPFISMVFCTGLFIFNYQLYRKTKAVTPWKGSLIAFIIIVISFVLSIL